MSKTINIEEIKTLVNSIIKEEKNDFWENSSKEILKEYLIFSYLKERDLKESINFIKDKTYSEFLDEISFLINDNEKELERRCYSGFSNDLLKELEKKTGYYLYSNFINKLNKN